MLVAISERLVRILPPAFIALALLNVAFMGGLTWVVSHNVDARNAMISRLVETCTGPRR